jgi:methyl-accepting chemotaxis protein
MINYDELNELANDMEKRSAEYDKKHKETMAKFDAQINHISNRIKENGKEIQSNLKEMRRLDDEFESMSRELDALENW